MYANLIYYYLLFIIVFYKTDNNLSCLIIIHSADITTNFNNINVLIVMLYKIKI